MRMRSKEEHQKVWFARLKLGIFLFFVDMFVAIYFFSCVNVFIGRFMVIMLIPILFLSLCSFLYAIRDPFNFSNLKLKINREFLEVLNYAVGNVGYTYKGEELNEEEFDKT